MWKHPVRIIIDALDETDDWKRLLNALKTVSTNIEGGEHVKILVSGRPDVDFPSYAENSEKVWLTSALSQADLQAFVVQEVKNK